MLRSVCLNSFFTRPLYIRKLIHTNLLKTESDGTFIVSITNDGKEGNDKDKDTYLNRSFHEFKKTLGQRVFSYLR